MAWHVKHSMQNAFAIQVERQNLKKRPREGPDKISCVQPSKKYMSCYLAASDHGQKKEIRHIHRLSTCHRKTQNCFLRLSHIKTKQKMRCCTPHPTPECAPTHRLDKSQCSHFHPHCNRLASLASEWADTKNFTSFTCLMLDSMEAVLICPKTSQTF